jgi:hypothetical protein
MPDTVALKASNTSELDARVDYNAKDSIVFRENGTVYLYREGVMVYQSPKPIELKADFIRMNMDSSLLYASGLSDTIGVETGTPVFKDGGEEYRARDLSYNLKTKRAYIRRVVTQQGEGYIVADRTKKTADDMMFMKGGTYSTCDHHDHPHFYLQLTKAKVKPGSFIAAGPAYLVIEDVPLPLAIPFGFFPFNQTYSSGVIMPSYGDEMERGLFLRDGGYYFAINDYVDLALTGEIFTKGTWAVRAASTYKMRYKFSGSVDVAYRQDVFGEKGMSDYSKRPSFSLNWRHTQDPKANQFRTLSASVNFTSSGYNRNNVNNVYNPALQSQNITSSSVNYSQRFPESPWSLSLNVGVTQRTQDSTISMTLPTFTAAMSRIYPLKRKNAVGKERFYEKIAFSYTMSFENSINTKESKLLHSSFTRDWSNAVRHTLPVSASFTVLRYLSITPSINYNSRWYFNKIERSWDTQTQQELLDTLSGFYRVYDFNMGVSMNTKLFGFYTPSRAIFGDRIDQIRHVMTPTLSFSYAPDFSDPMWRFYKSYEKVLIDPVTSLPTSQETITYSPYSSGKYGIPGRGKTGSLGFSLGNNVEMKVKDRRASDTTANVVYKKISLIDNFSISGNYNIAADSMRWSNFSASLRVKLTKSFTLNLSGAFDPYMYALNASGTPVRVNRLRWDNGKLPRFLGTRTTFAYSLNNDTFKKKQNKDANKQQTEEDDLSGEDENAFDLDPNKQQEKTTSDEEKETKPDAEGYEKIQIKWNISFSYSVGWQQQSGLDNFDFDKMEYKRKWDGNTVSLSGYINPTPYWKLNCVTTLDLKNWKFNGLTLSMSRDLHCWTLSATVTPIGLYKSFMITIGVNSSMLRDMKYEKKSDVNSSTRWF